MNATTVSSLIIAGLAVLGSIGSVTLLAFRTGSLVGQVTGHMKDSEQDRLQIWAAIGKSTDRLERHIENHR